jgi:uncharacterized protein YuzE
MHDTLKILVIGGGGARRSQVLTIDGEYDPKADIASLRFEGWNSPTAVTEQAEYGFRTIDPATRKLVGVTYWQASQNLPSELLAMLPERPGAVAAA